MGSLGIPGVIHDHVWEGFGANRTRSMEEARKHCPDGWSWVIDADDQIQGTPLPAAWWNSLDPSFNALELYTKFGAGINMYRPQIFSNRSDWRYQIRELHEAPQLIGEPMKSLVLPPTIWQQVSHEGARSQKPHKAYTDYLLLLKDKMKMPNDERTMYYLGQQCKNLACMREAKQYYKLRVAMLGGSLYERYLSLVEIIQMTSSFEKKIKLAWDAVEIDPTRLEAPYLVLAEAVRLGKYPNQVVALGMVVRNPGRAYLPEHRMTLREDIYTWGFSDSFSIVLYYTGHYQKCHDEATFALSRCPEEQKPRIGNTVRFAADRLKEGKK